MSGKQIDKCDSINLLGVKISKDLLWNEHIISMALNASKKLGLLNKCKSFFTPYQLLHIYKSYIRPCMEYCSQVWGAASDSILALLDSIQKRAIKIIGDKKITSSLDSLGHRRVVNDLAVIYKYRHQRRSDDIRNSMPKTLIRPRYTRQAVKLNSQSVEIIRSRTSNMQRDFFNRTAHKWNDLPESIIEGSFDLRKFKNSIHGHLRTSVNN